MRGWTGISKRRGGIRLFKTSVTAELYTHFPFINSPVSQPDSSCTKASVEDNTDSSRWGTNAKQGLHNWACGTWALAAGMKRRQGEVLGAVSQKERLSIALRVGKIARDSCALV